MRNRSFLVVAITVLAVLGIAVALAVPSVASAAPAAPAATKTVPWESVDLVVHDDQGQQLMILAGTIATGTPLPAEVEIAVPAGLQLQWAGEILGGDVSKDPAVTPSITKSGNSDIYRFRLTQARTAQLELLTPGAVQLNGSNYKAAISWTPSQPLKELKIGFRVPANAQIVTPVPGAAEAPGPTGFDYYRSTLTNLEANKPVTFAFDYTVPATAAGTSASGGSGSAATMAIIAVLFAVIAGLIFVVSQKLKAKNAVAETPARTAPASRAASSGSKAAAARATSGKASTAKGGSGGGAKGGTPAKDEPAPAPRSKAPVIVLGVIAVLVVGAIYAVNTGSKPTVAGDRISRTFAQVDVCTTTKLPLTAKATDVDKATEELFKVLQSVSGVGNATVDRANRILEVGH